MVNRQRLSDEFARLAAINSPPLHENKIALYLAERFEKLGAEVFLTTPLKRRVAKSET